MSPYLRYPSCLRRVSPALCCIHRGHTSVSFIRLKRSTMIGASEPLEIKLCEGWRAAGCLSFYPLSRETPFPSSRLARHLTLRLHVQSALFNRLIAGMLVRKSVSSKSWDALPLSEPHSIVRSRRDLRPRCSTVLRMSLYLSNRRHLQ